MNLNEIERLAREATPGPWQAVQTLPYGNVTVEAGDWSAGFKPKDGKYIASVSPDVVLKMIERIRAADELYKWGGHLIGDFTADDDLPTHYNSWFSFERAQEKYRQISEGE